MPRNPGEGSHGGNDAAVQAGESGIGAAPTERMRKDIDTTLLDLQARNLARAIADGDVAGCVQLGVAFGQFIATIENPT